MYNRYTPRPDGSFCRSRIPEPRPTPAHPPTPKPEPEPPCPPTAPAPPPPKNCPHCRTRRIPKQEPKEEASISGFLKKLLPKDFDTGDLMIVLLLLLMAGDCHEDQNNALLTLTLYLFM